MRLFASPDSSARLSSGLEGLHHTESPSGGRPFTVQDLQRMIAEGVRQQIQEREKNKAAGPLLDIDNGPLAPEIYSAPDSDVKTPQLDSFKGASDARDPESFVYGFRERMRLAQASDAVMCRLFCTCLTGEAWDWYMRLPHGSIKSFADFMRAFLKRYAGIK